MKAFQANKAFTLGVEEEYQLCDPASGDLVQRVDDVLQCFDGEFREHLCYELLLSVLETNTKVCSTIDELVADIAFRRRTLIDKCHELGIAICAAGTHPYARWQDQQFVKSEHYQWVARQLGYLAQRNITFGLHIHIGVDDAEGAVYTVNMMRRWVPPFLALSANSPFFEGRKTGLLSTRTAVFGNFPRTGYPPAFQSYQHLERCVDSRISGGAIRHPRDLWWNLRPHPSLGTVEIRTCDVQTSFERTGALAALFQALVATYMDRFHNGHPISSLDRCALEDGLWQGMRLGLDGMFFDSETEEVMDMREAVHRMVQLALPMADKLGTGAWLEKIEEICSDGNEADQQILFYNEKCKESLPELQQWLIRKTGGASTTP